MRLLFILIVLCVASCTERQSLDGHWVSKEFFEGKPFFTLDINEKDSSAVVNGASFFPSHSFYRIRREYAEYVFDCIGYILILDGDSLHSYDEPNGEYNGHTYSFSLDSCTHKNGSQYNSVLVRIDPKETFFKTLFLRVSVEVELPIETYDFVKAKLNTKFLTLTIGAPLDSAYDKSDIVFQADDVYLGKEDLPNFIIRSAAGYSAKQQKDLVIRLNADKDISDEYLRSFFPNNDSIPLWRTYLNRDKTALLYKPI